MNSFANYITAESLSTLIFQYEADKNKIITDVNTFNNNEPRYFYLNSKNQDNQFLKVKVTKGNNIFINNKHYKSFQKTIIQLIPISNIKLFSRNSDFVVCITGPILSDFNENLSIVYWVNNPEITNKSFKDNSVAWIKTSTIFTFNNFNQFAFISLMLITVFFNQSLFAKRTVFVGASAIRQSRFRSMDDNLKLFGFNVLLFSFLFTGFSLQKSSGDVFLFGIIMRNIFLICLFFGFKIFLNGATKKVFFDSNALSFYANNYLHITAIFGISLASLFYLETFSYFSFPKIPIGAYLIIFILAESAYVVSFAFMNYELSKYKLFYIFSYICAFEGIPLLILAKYLFQLGIISP